MHQPFERLETLLRCNPVDSGCLDLAADPLPLFLCFAKPRPRPPRDGLSGQAQRAPVRRELIKKRVGSRVVRLARIAQDAGHAREQDKHIQVPVLGRTVQVPGPQYLGP